MARYIRERDWCDTPLGAIGSWPPSLKTTLGLALEMREPAAVAWGPACRLLYNDGYATLMGHRHPVGLGRPFAEVWPEIFEELRPRIEAVLSGATQALDGRLPDLAGPGNSVSRPEVVASWTPIRLESGAVGGFLSLGVDTTARHRTEQALEASEERHRLILESALDYAIFTIDADGIVTSWPAGAQAVFGWSEAEMIGQDVAITFTPEDRANEAPQRERDEARRHGVATNTRWHLRKDERRIFIEGSVRRLRSSGSSDGHGFIKIGADVTKRREAEKRLRDNRRRLRSVVEGIPQLIWRAALGGEWTWASPQWGKYTGQKGALSHGFGWLAALHPDDRGPALEGWRNADGSSYLDMETRLYDAGEGRYRWFQSRALPIRDETGRIIEWLGTSTDVDDMRQLQERQTLLLAELQHRTRNLLGVVRAMADRTAAGANSLEAFLPPFRERLAALSRINGLLSKLEHGERVTFDTLILTELGARGALEDVGGRIVLDGPADVRLRSASVQTFALAIHELATNAVKYGALAAPDGRLSVRWRADLNEAGARRLHVEWIESGVPNVPAPDAPPRGGGYGRLLIERSLPYQLHAAVAYELSEGGVRCTIDLPLGSSRQRGDTQ
ncbi:PAS domain-containing sensor histidine kinase [Antarcticirhabdus aurantiaca]|uniref:PAS domain S-box protein n=1 Tax=Antarcticirhabdus aurantiaca TaxID=2606717 RepID=A0ACD4NJM9_9HYPH|nr:PAS domain S-box protein [Antarcticirhabdus aurantiaca]WAJ27009.1 PAS domain S-box protein [Jeongeuplla avenae]